jgi:hypothetical protein
MSNLTQNRPRSSHPGLRAPRHVFSPDHDVTAKGSTRAAMRAAVAASNNPEPPLTVMPQTTRAASDFEPASNGANTLTANHGY